MVHSTKSVLPMVIDVGFGIDAAGLYDAIFGRNAHRGRNHSENFGCVKNFTEIITLSVDKFLNKTIASTEMRDAALTINLPELGGLDGRSRRSAIFPSLGRGGDGVDNKRDRRSITAAIAIASSMIALAGTVTDSIVFAKEIDSIKHTLQSVQNQVELDYLTSRNIAKGLSRVKNEMGVISLRIDRLFQEMGILRNTHACFLKKDFVSDQVAEMDRFLELTYNDLSGKRLTPRLIPVELISDLIKTIPQSRNSLMSAFPFAMYQEGRISIVSANKDRKTVRMLLAFPMVSKRPEYVKINLLSPLATIKDNNSYHGLRLELENMNLAIPIRFVRRKNFDVTKLTDEQIKSLVYPIDCTTIQGILTCKTFLPANPRTTNCLRGLFLENKNLLATCPVTDKEQSEHLNIDTHRGSRGLAISSSGSYSIYGIEGTSGLEKTHLLAHSNSQKDNAICAYIPSQYSKLRVQTENEEFEIMQTIFYSMNSLLGTRMEQYGEKHYLWFKNTEVNWISNWTNMTDVDKEARFQLLDMSRKISELSTRNEHLEWKSIMLYMNSGMLLILGITFTLIMCKRRRDKKCVKCFRCSNAKKHEYPRLNAFKRASKRFSRKLSRKDKGTSDRNLVDPENGFPMARMGPRILSPMASQDEDQD